MNMSRQLDLPAAALIFRAALLLSALGLAAYIPFKYATQLHAFSGIYAFLFPLSGLLALAGIVVAVKPETACSCGMPMRSGIGALSLLWMVTGVLCVKSLAVGVMNDPAQGSIAMIHMLSQHVFLSLSLLSFAFFPERMVRALGPRLSEHARH
jgi:hypothetical protein